MNKWLWGIIIGGLVVAGTVVAFDWLRSWFWELPIYLKLILVFTAISALIGVASAIGRIYDWVKAKWMQKNLEKIKKETKLRTPEIRIYGVWGPYGGREKATNCFELKRNRVEFLTINIHNNSRETYSFRSEISFPEGFNLLMKGDANLKRAKLGKTKEFIDDLVGEGNPPEYIFLPKFGGDFSEPKDIQHDRRIFRQREVSSPIGPGSTFLNPFWVKTPDRRVRDGKIHISVITNLLIPSLKVGTRMKTVEYDIGIKTA